MDIREQGEAISNDREDCGIEVECVEGEWIEVKANPKARWRDRECVGRGIWENARSCENRGNRDRGVSRSRGCN